MPCKRGFYVKSYVFFETITYLFKNCKLISNGNISRTKTNLLSELRFSKNWQECYFYSNWRFSSCNCIKNNIPTVKTWKNTKTYTMLFLHCVMILIVPHRQKEKKEKKKKTYPYCLHKRKLAAILFLLSNVRTRLLEMLSYIKTPPKSYSCSTSLQVLLRITLSSAGNRQWFFLVTLLASIFSFINISYLHI